jgi:hypothetical protein
MVCYDNRDDAIASARRTAMVAQGAGFVVELYVMDVGGELLLADMALKPPADGSFSNA